MRFVRLLVMLCAVLLLAGAIFHERATANGNAGQPKLKVDGGAPLPRPPQVADGGAPLLRLSLVADGTAPLPRPPQFLDGGASLPRPSLVADGTAPLPRPPSKALRLAIAA